MATTTRKQVETLRRLWKAPTTRARWYWLAVSIIIYGSIFWWYLLALRTQRFPGPIDDPLRLFGIIAFTLILGSAAYSLRRRFARGLPGKVQSWLWMHTWLGITTILIVLLHENLIAITHDYCQNFSCLTDAYGGISALLALFVLVASGITGRIIDVWQTHSIASDAAANGVGIARALEERILELEYTVERLCAGKSEQFKAYCLQAIEDDARFALEDDARVVAPIPEERADFRHAYTTLVQRARLLRSLHRQTQARLIIRNWRVVHMSLASLSLLIITYHAVMELLVNVFHVIQPA